MDDMTPNVWEEAYGTGLAGTPNTVSGVSGGAGIEITPSMTPDGLTVRAAWSPDAGGSAGSDKGTGQSSGSTLKGGYSITAEATSDITGMEGLTLYGGLARIDQYQNDAGINDDKEEYTIGVKYAVGGFTLGYQYSKEDTGRATTNLEYENNAYGITFAINDDLSIGYNNYKSDRKSTTNTELEASSVQIAYSMGGVSVRLADASIDNQNYSTAATNQREATTLSIALAF
jgi:outer membrane protein OmpU